MELKKRYKKALVMFIDLLGTQSRSDFNELLETNEVFHSELLGNIAQNRDYNACQRHIYTFSDCAYIIYDFRNGAHEDWNSLFEVALQNCEPILMIFLSKGILVRGGVAFGDIYYDESRHFFFGDAVNRAYRYESKAAKYPRIVVEDTIADAIIQHAQSRKKSLRDKSSSQTHKDCIVNLDSDGLYYMNYFNSIQQGRDYSKIIGKSNKTFIDEIIALCDSQICAHESNDNVRSKYEWLKHYAESSNAPSGETQIVYRKPFWDKVFQRLSDEDIKLLQKKMRLDCSRNVGIPYDPKIKEFIETFETPELLDFLKRFDDLG